MDKSETADAIMQTESNSMQLAESGCIMQTESNSMQPAESGCIKPTRNGIKPAESDRLQYIDTARGIAMICIILGHLGITGINRVVFTFHVPVFYFITGYFISNKKSIWDFAKSRLRTLIVPYAVTCGIMILIGTAKGFIQGDALSPLKTWCYAAFYGAGDSYTEPFSIPAIGALWFLLATFWGSLFLRISLCFNKYVRAAFIIVLFLLGYFSRGICWFPFSIQAGACAALFMYIGFLLKDMKGLLGKIPAIIKYFVLAAATVVWFFFIKNFQSFWLVHCDIGRGVIDVLGCICACAVFMFFCRLIDTKLKRIGGFFACFGRYSLLVLCVHNIELNLFPWWRITEKLAQFGMSENFQLLIIIIAKVVVDLACAYALSKIAFVRKVYGYKK